MLTDAEKAAARTGTVRVYNQYGEPIWGKHALL